MAKDRIRPSDEAKIKEKRSSKDKVKKSEKHKDGKTKKEKRSKKLEEELAKNSEIAPLDHVAQQSEDIIKDEKPKKEKKERKAKKLAEEPAKHPEALFDQAMKKSHVGPKQPPAEDEESKASPEKGKKSKAPEDFIALESSDEDEKKKKKHKKHKKLEQGEQGGDSEQQPNPLFVFDTTRVSAKTKKNPSSDSESDSDSGSDAENKTKTKKPSGISARSFAEEAEIKQIPGIRHLERRFLLLKAREKGKIQKQFGIQPGSKEFHPEVEKKLEAWVKKRREQQARIEERRTVRTAKKAARRLRKMSEKREKQKIAQKKSGKKAKKADEDTPAE